MRAKFFAYKLMDKVEIDADSVELVAPDGTIVELDFRRSDGEISLSINGQMSILPKASNMVRISKLHD